MDQQLRQLFDAHDDVVTRTQLLTVATPGDIRGLRRRDEIHQLWHGIYSASRPTPTNSLRGLTLSLGHPVVACMGTAAHLYGFDTENTSIIHIVDPAERHIRSRQGLAIHQRVGAPTVTVAGLDVTAPAWTAVEVARTLDPGRALATLDMSLRSGLVTVADLHAAELRQATRAGIVEVRRLIPLADAAAGSPMESEMRLVLHDGGVPQPHLQWPVFGSDGQVRFYLDCAWPEVKLALEYDGDEFHSSPLDVRRDKLRTSWLLDHGWLVVHVVAEDIRRHPEALCRRVLRQLSERRYARVV